MHPRTAFIITPVHIGDWGHTARDLGIRAARGRWIIHTNADNIFYPNLIAVLKATLTDPLAWKFTPRRSKRIPSTAKWLAAWLDRTFDTDYVKTFQPEVFESRDPQILVYSIVMRGLLARGDGYIRVRDVAERQGVIFGGIPMYYGSIDAMQLVMQRALWLAEGGWHAKAGDSDAVMYPAFAAKYRVLSVPSVLGEHW